MVWGLIIALYRWGNWASRHLNPGPSHFSCLIKGKWGAELWLYGAVMLEAGDQKILVFIPSEESL